MLLLLLLLLRLTESTLKRQIAKLQQKLIEKINKSQYEKRINPSTELF